MRALPVLLVLVLLAPGCIGLRDDDAADAEGASDAAEWSPAGPSAAPSDPGTVMADGSAATTKGAGSERAYAESMSAGVSDAPASSPSWVDPRQLREGIGSGLTAGDIDDHLNWAAYLRYAARTAGGQQSSSDTIVMAGLPILPLQDRFTLRLVDAGGAPLGLTPVTIRATDAAAQGSATTLLSGTDGIVRVLPRFDGLGAGDRWRIDVGGLSFELHEEDLDADRELTITVPTRTASLPRALDLMLVIDTTGSMSDELDYLTRELRAIVAGIEQREGVDVRVGLIVYRDVGDDYVVDSLGFSDDVSVAERWIGRQAASGGGDYPEAMDRALASALDDTWRDGRDGDTARVLLLVADAPPHAEDYDAFTDAVKEARREGVRVYPVAASGAAREAQYLMRAAAMATQARYLFLTDDSGIGKAHDEPDVPCYDVSELKDLVQRVIAGELRGERVEAAPEEILRAVGEQDAGVCV